MKTSFRVSLTTFVAAVCCPSSSFADEGLEQQQRELALHLKELQAALRMREIEDFRLNQREAERFEGSRELVQGDSNVVANQVVAQQIGVPVAVPSGGNFLSMMMSEFNGEQGGGFEGHREMVQVDPNAAANQVDAQRIELAELFQVDPNLASNQGNEERIEVPTESVAAPNGGNFLSMMMSELNGEQGGGIEEPIELFQVDPNIASNQGNEERIEVTTESVAAPSGSNFLSKMLSELRGEEGVVEEPSYAAPNVDVLTETSNEASFAVPNVEVDPPEVAYQASVAAAANPEIYTEASNQASFAAPDEFTAPDVDTHPEVANQEPQPQEAPNAFMKMFQHELDTENKFELTFGEPTTLTSNEEHQMAVRYALEFDECTNLTLEECKAEIDKLMREQPELFDGVERLNYNVEVYQQPGAENAHHIGLVTNVAGTHVAGHNGDGIVNYHNPNWGNRDSVWCTSNEACDDENRLRHIEDKCCFSVGPWDCDPGYPKTVDECCNMIKGSMPGLDQNGNEIYCHVAYPLGSAQNPVDYSRVNILVDENGNIMGEPVNE